MDNIIEDREKIINDWIDEVNKKKNRSQKEVLTMWWSLILEYPSLKYDMLRFMNKARGRTAPYPKEWLKISRHRFEIDNFYHSRYGKSLFCFLHPDYERPHAAYAKHHIIKLSAWGTNHPLNIVTLCYRCHAYFHPWLWEKADLHEKYHEENAVKLLPRPIAKFASHYHSDLI